MHKVDLLSTFLCDLFTAGKSQHFIKLRDDRLYFIVNSFDNYV